MNDLQGWIPYRLVVDNNTPIIHWLYTSDIAFDAPFFEETIARCKSHPNNSNRYKCVSSPESLIEWSESFPAAIPEAIIFHISRCGSTLLSQLIGSDKHFIVLSEVPLFDEILRLPLLIRTLKPPDTNKLLQAAIRITANHQTISSQKLFIKTDSWHIFYQSIYRSIFPSSPFILLYRSPDEVLHSHSRQRGMQAVPNVIEPEVFGFQPEEIENLTLDAYTAAVLEKYLTAFDTLYKMDVNCLLLNYNEGPENMIKKTGSHLNIFWTDRHLHKMKERGKFHSKHPGKHFEEEKQAVLTDTILKSAMKVYQKVEAARIASN